MEIIIDIPEEMYAQIIDENSIETMLIPYKDIIKNGTPLPDNSTNGDMIKAMFPNTEIEGIEGLEGLQCVAVSIGLGTSYFALDWWNAPYKAESEVEE